MVLRLSGERFLLKLAGVLSDEEANALHRAVDERRERRAEENEETATRYALLNTSFLADLMNGDEYAVEEARELETTLVQQRLSSMSLFELYYGIARVSDEHYLTRNVDDFERLGVEIETS